MINFKILYFSFLSLFWHYKIPFRVGVSTSSYQIESPYNRSSTIWDEFSFIKNNDSVSEGPLHDFYFREDFSIIENLGMKDYRMSFSWARIMNFRIISSKELSTNKSLVRIHQEPNLIGVGFYKNLIEDLKKRDIDICVTLFHWDLPSIIQNNLNGFESEQTMYLFKNYSNYVFETFGEDVKCWITINEPLTFMNNGYKYLTFPPAKNVSTEMFEIIQKNLVQSHIMVYELYDKEYRHEQNGVVSISLNSDWVECENKNILESIMGDMLGYYADPLFFDSNEALLSRPYLDFFALNHYSTIFLDKEGNKVNSTYYYPNNVFSDSSWLVFAPDGFGKLLSWIDKRYLLSSRNISMRITENGWSSTNLFCDDDRIQYLKSYMKKAIKSDIYITHYYIWSLLDNFEWASGFSERFGLVYVNFTSPYKERIPKVSASWLKKLLITNYL